MTEEEIRNRLNQDTKKDLIERLVMAYKTISKLEDRLSKIGCTSDELTGSGKVIKHPMCRTTKPENPNPHHPDYEGHLQWLPKEHFESRCAGGENEGKPITFNGAAPGDLKVGDYVFASHWSDCDPQDPWHVGKVTEVGAGFVVVGDVSQRRWRRATRISPEKGKEIIDWFRHRE